MNRMIGSLFLLLAFTACVGERTASTSCPQPGLAIEDWEAQILGPTLEELREGVHPLGEQGFGVCRGKTECEEFLGQAPGDLAPGEYFLRTELKVPRAGSAWKAEFNIECRTVGKETPPQVHKRSYDLKYMGPERGQRIQPLWRIQSPHPNGVRTCSYSLTPIRPDGVAGKAWEGTYTTPAPVEEATP
jgi:hypothetical protein